MFEEEHAMREVVGRPLDFWQSKGFLKSVCIATNHLGALEAAEAHLLQALEDLEINRSSVGTSS
jgi:hypothetical protein